MLVDRRTDTRGEASWCFLQFIIMRVPKWCSQNMRNVMCLSVSSLCDGGDKHSGYQTKMVLCDQLTEDFVSELTVTDGCETQRYN